MAHEPNLDIQCPPVSMEMTLSGRVFDSRPGAGRIPPTSLTTVCFSPFRHLVMGLHIHSLHPLLLISARGICLICRPGATDLSVTNPPPKALRIKLESIKMPHALREPPLLTWGSRPSSANGTSTLISMSLIYKAGMTSLPLGWQQGCSVAMHMTCPVLPLDPRGSSSDFTVR